MNCFESIIDGKEVAILYESDFEPCTLYVRYLEMDVVRHNHDEFVNAKQLSASLACTLGYGPACDFLHQHSVPYSSTLWDLNHSGPPNV